MLSDSEGYISSGQSHSVTCMATTAETAAEVMWYEGGNEQSCSSGCDITVIAMGDYITR